MWIEIERPAPVLNTGDFAFVFGGGTKNQIPLNERGHPFFFEFVALPGMVFNVLEEIGASPIVRVAAEFYPKSPLYIDSRFAKKGERPNSKSLALPSREAILQKMEQMIGIPYVWGGNWHRGIPEMLEFYPPLGTLDPKMETLWILRGVDCSGLLYEAAGGLTPRNTSDLLHFGKALEIEGLDVGKIGSILAPLDMIIHPGHVLFVRDRDTLIESKAPYGVIVRKTEERLRELSSFLVRRFL